MSRVISQAVAPSGVACSPQVPVRPEPRSSHSSALVSLIAALSSLGSGLSPWAVPPALLLGTLGLFAAQQAQAAPPAAPVLQRITPNDGDLSLFWTAPAGTLTGYDLHYTSAPTSGSGAVTNDATVQTGGAAAGWVASSSPGSTSTFADITDLTNGTEYRVRLRAKNSDGDSDWVFGTGTPNLTLEWQQAATLQLSEGATSIQQRLTDSAASSALSVTLTYAPGATNPASLEDDLVTGYATTFSSAANTIPTIRLAASVNDTVN